MKSYRLDRCPFCGWVVNEHTMALANHLRDHCEEKPSEVSADFEDKPLDFDPRNDKAT